MPRPRPSIPRAAAAALAACLVLAGPLRATAAPPAAGRTPVTVFAAASMVDALRRIDAAFVAHGNPAPVLSLGSSGALAKQIEAGAPADVFVSADTRWMTALRSANLLVPGSETTIAGNTLVLVEPKAGVRPVDLSHGFDPAAVLGADGRLSVGDTASVPAGIYARQALTALGVWDRVKDRLAPATDVRAALLQVTTGAAPAGIVYGSDAHATGAVAVAGVFPASSHDPIVYPAAALLHGRVDGARAYLLFLGGIEARRILRESGFQNPTGG